MRRLVEADRASAGKPELGDQTPSGFLHVRTPNALRLQCRYLGLQIVTHEIDFVPVVLLGRMNGQFCRRQREDQPSLASVHGWKSKNVPEEEAISSRILAVDNHVRTEDHELDLPRSRDLVIQSLPLSRACGPQRGEALHHCNPPN